MPAGLRAGSNKSGTISAGLMTKNSEKSSSVQELFDLDPEALTHMDLKVTAIRNFGG